MTPYNPRLAVAVRHVLLGLAALGSPALAAETADEKQRRSLQTLDTLHVTGVSEESSKIATPHSIVSRERILSSDASTLGDAIEHLPGVRADNFGAVSRPIIRGQTAPRVKVLADSSSLIDASEISPDHAVTVDPLLASRVEVLRGPATLRYGGGAVGGVVNVLDDKIPTQLPANGSEGQWVIRGNSVAKEKAFGAAISSQLGNSWVLHAEGSSLDRDDYRAPKLVAPAMNPKIYRELGFDKSHIADTYAQSENGSVGLSWVTDNGYVGLAYSYRQDEYGIPGHSHTYERCAPVGSVLRCGDHYSHPGMHRGDHAHAHSHDHGPSQGPHKAWIDLSSKRVDLRSDFSDPLPGIAQVRFRANHTDYRHDELEGNTIATTFTNKGYDSRLELEHAPVGALTGVMGVQHSDTRLSTQGIEAFLPTVDTVSTGVFLIEHYTLNEHWHFELGGRREWLKHTPQQDPRGRPAFEDTATSFSGSASWRLAPDLSLTFLAARSQRLPHAQEMYARGPHMATRTYECGLLPDPLTCGGLQNNAPYGKESSRNYEVVLRKVAGDLDFSVGAYLNQVDNYIYARPLARIDAFTLIKYGQDDVKFHGLEAEVNYRMTDHLTVGAYVDQVRARFSYGDELPRTPPSRIGARARFEQGAFSGEVDFYRVVPQHRIAPSYLETRSVGYDMLNLTLEYILRDGRTRLFVGGKNLLNE
ncbi:MAG TPA: TonB-dependent receptor, partial [Stenotrophomonas sp.]